jgi:hypothetical protein
MLTKLLTAPFKLFSPLKQFGYRLFFAIGAGVAVLFIGWSLLLDKQVMAVLLASLGTGLGVLIMSLTLPKLFVAADSARQRQLELDMQRALKERSKLVGELERIKSQQLQLQQIKSVMKLTLLEVDVALTDFKQDDLGEHEKTLGGKTHTQYIGVLRKKVNAMLGIDLNQVQVKPLGKVLLVSDLHAQYHGVSADSEEWLFRQLQVHEDNVVFPNKIHINTESKELMQATDQHREDLNGRIRQGIALKAFDQAIEKMAEQWLKLVFAPMGFQVQLGEVVEGISLLDFLKQTQLHLEHAEQLLVEHLQEAT